MNMNSRKSLKKYQVNVFLLLFIQLIMTNSSYAKIIKNPELMTQAECMTDLNYSADFLLHNDAGIISKRWITYPSNLQEYLNSKNATEQRISTAQDCKKVINNFFKQIRKGHLGLSSAKDTPIVAKEEQKKIHVKKLSANTTYINIPSFMPYAKLNIENIIKMNQAGIKTSDYLIIDLRNNEGGDDSTFQPLFSLMGMQEYKIDDIPLIYASEKNTKSWENIIQYIDNAEDKKMLIDIVNQMKDKKNQWVKLYDQPDLKLSITQKDVVSKTKKIAILIDENCGSSCEQFVLLARQNPRVTTIGRNTYGAIDASNVRSEATPSGKFLINYATTFIIRKDNERIDGIGIPPNILLKKPKNLEEEKNEITIAKNILESK